MRVCSKLLGISDVDISYARSGIRCVNCDIAVDWRGQSASALLEHLVLHVNDGYTIPKRLFINIWRTIDLDGDLVADWEISAVVHMRYRLYIEE